MNKYFNYTYDNVDKFSMDYYTKNNNKIIINVDNNLYLHTKPRKVPTNNKVKSIKLKEKIKCNFCGCLVYNYKVHSKSKKHIKNYLNNDLNI